MIRKTAPWALLFALLPMRAGANVAASEQPADPGGAFALGPRAAISVERELLEITCAEHGDQPSCQFRATYYLVNPTGDRAAAIAAFWGGGDDVVIELQGRGGRELSSEEVDAVVRAMDAIERPPESLSRPKNAGIDLLLEPGQRAELAARGSLRLGWAGRSGYAIEPVHARHGLLQPDAPASRFALASYYLSPIRSFHAAGPITLVVHHPSAWIADVSLETTDSRVEPVELSGGRAQIDAGRARMLHLRFDQSRTFHVGGPFVGIGGAFGEGGGFRLRGGWELAAPAWLFWSATAETDASELFQVTPLVEAASDQVLIIPSFGFGVGAPIRIEPEPAVGARVQASVAFYKLGAVGSFDWFPKGDAGSTETRFSLLAYVWL